MPNKSLPPLHSLIVGPKGTFHSGGKFSSSPKDVDYIIGHLKQNKIQKVVLYFHGGLVPEASGLETAAMIEKLFSGTNCFPISLVWKTGLLETVRTHIDSISQTRFFHKLLEYTIKVAAEQIGLEDIGGKGPTTLTEKDIVDEIETEDPFSQFYQHVGGKGLGKIEMVDDESLKNELNARLNLLIQIDESKLSADEIQSEATEVPLLDRDKISEDPEDGGKGIIVPLKLIKSLTTVTFRIVKRHVSKNDHGFFPTVVEEILREFYLADFGSWVWGGMKQQAEDMWASNNGLTGADMHVGAYLLESLNKLKIESKEISIGIVGHSAGAIVTCNLLSVTATRFPNLKFQKIIFLAPACTVDLFVKEVIGRENRFEEFRMFTMLDETEKKDHLVNRIYNRSLLYFISGVLEQSADKPIVGLHRHIIGQSPYDSDENKLVQDFFFKTGANRLVLSCTESNALPGFQCDSQKHGDFDNNEATQQSILHFLIR